MTVQPIKLTGFALAEELQAVSSLGRSAGTHAQQALLARCDTTEDAHVLAHVANTLGQIGDDQALTALANLAAHPSKQVARQARFAASLIAHRHGLPGYEIRLPERVPSAIPDTFRFEVDIGEIQRSEQTRFRMDLQRESHGLLLEFSFAVALEIDDERWILIPRAEFCGSTNFARIATVKAVLGVVAERPLDHGGYSPSLLILTTPEGDGCGARMHLHHPDGDLIYLGSARVERESIAFAIAGAVVPYWPPIQLEGRLSVDGLEIQQAYSAVASGDHIVAGRLNRSVASAAARRDG